MYLFFDLKIIFDTPTIEVVYLPTHIYSALSSISIIPILIFHYILMVFNICSLVAKSCPTLCGPTDYNPPGSSVHEIL